jgi:uncharacterized membrane protein
MSGVKSQPTQKRVSFSFVMKKTQTRIIWIATILGMAVSGYLSVIKLTHTPIYCTPGLGDCATVNSSQWSLLWGIPIAIFGFLSYLAILILMIFGPKVKILTTYWRYAILGIGLFGFLYSLYLTYLEIFVIKAVCQWCITSAVCMTTIFIASCFLVKHQTAANNQ